MGKPFVLYGGEVTGNFEPEARFRYKITDPIVKMIDKRVRGVTTVIGDILDKPGLRLWARDEMSKFAFGMKNVKGKATYHKRQALIKPDTKYTEEQLQAILDNSFDAYKLKTDRGKDIGTMAHDFVAQYLDNGTIADMDEIIKLYPEAPEEFCNSVLKALNCFVGWWESIEDKEVIATENIIYSRTHNFSGTYDLKARIGDKIYMLDLKTTNRSLNAPLGVYPEYFMQLGGYILADEEESGSKFDDCGVINVGKDGKLSIVLASDMGVTVDECKKSFVVAIQIHNWLSRLKKMTSEKGLISSLMKGDE